MKTLRLVIICFFALMLVFPVIGQEVKKVYKDKIVLYNGSVFYGNILDYNPEGEISVEMESGKVLTFSAEQTKKVIMNRAKGPGASLPMKANKVCNETQLSMLAGDSANGLSVAHNVLYQFKPKLAAGIGIGIDNYYKAAARNIFPLYGNVRYYFIDASHSPYIGMSAGYGFAFKNEDENLFKATGGLMTNPYIGTRFGSRGLMINVFMGLKFQKVDYEFSNAFESLEEDIYFRRMNIGAAVMF